TPVFYNRFQDYQPHITITLQDGTTQVYPKDYDEDDVFPWISIEDDQNAENPWTVGEHTATAYLSTERSEESVEVPFKVIVTKSPVTSITVDDITVGYESFVSGATGTYYKFNPKVNVQMEDGTTAVLSPNEVFTWQERDYTISLSDMNDMYYTSENYHLSNAYGVHILHAHFMGKTVPFKVTVNGIQSIRPDNIAYQDYRYTITYTAQKTDDTVCTGSFSIPQPAQFDECTIFDKTLGSVTLAYDDTYALRIGAHRIPLTTGETFRLYSELGDADGNGSVDIQDATFIQKGLAEFDDVSLNRNEYPERFYAADVNRNGKIDICDVTALQRMIAL
ncbi:MAG: dockerin type I repeat-containing protein, partial [Ruminococcus sp.]|nr:dockerin type I repeat-containing protein [Ruminococcus sp.]